MSDNDKENKAGRDKASTSGTKPKDYKSPVVLRRGNIRNLTQMS